MDIETPPRKLKFDLDLRNKKSSHTQAPTPVSPTDHTPYSTFMAGLGLGMSHGLPGLPAPPLLGQVGPLAHTGVAPDRFTPPCQAGQPARSLSPPYHQEPAGVYGIDGFLDFIPFTPGKKSQIRKLLIDEEIFDFRLINEVDLEVELLVDLGLKPATIKALFRGALKYRHKHDSHLKSLRTV